MQDPSAKAPVANTARPAAQRAFVLRFISGKYQGGEFPIVSDKQIIVGRSSDLDMVLVEDMVSRKHARIAMQSDQIWIEDLGSTNGTFVNGERVPPYTEVRLVDRDQIRLAADVTGDVSLPRGETDPASLSRNGFV